MHLLSIRDSSIIPSIIRSSKKDRQNERNNNYHFEDEGIEIKPLNEVSTITQNLLASLMGDDDPFEDEFN